MRIYRTGLTLGLMVALVAGTAHAQSLFTSSQRALFLQIEERLQTGQSSLTTNEKTLLGDYALYPYLLYHTLTNGLPNRLPAQTQISAFLTDYRNSPLARKLRAKLLPALAEKRRWTDLIEIYQADDRTDHACLYRQALLHTGNESQALNGLDAIWLQGRSQPDSCDPLFARWQQKGQRTTERIWQRFNAALALNNQRFARYLSNLLPAQKKRLAQQWLSVFANPSRALNGIHLPKTAATNELLMHAIKAASARDSVAAAPVWDQLKHHYQIPKSDDRDRIDRRLAVYVAARGHHSAARRLADLGASVTDAEVHAWRVRTAMARQDWRSVLEHLDRFPPELANKAQWRYWRARALVATGQRDLARSIYRKLATERDYHGFLAADRLQENAAESVTYQIDPRPITVDSTKIESISDHPGIRRALELWAIQRPGPARAEWQSAIAPFDQDQLLAAAKLAERIDWHDRAIATAARAGHWDDLTLRFPTPHREIVQRHANIHGVDPAWAYAVIRQESLFQTDVRSSAGALGLMQLMPATARRIAGKLHLPRPGKSKILQVSTNIQLGTYYLQHTRDTLQNNPVLATAAYNAGPNRVTKWLPTETLEADLWIELIPFRETRRYVKRVMEYAAVYARRLGQSPEIRVLDRMPPIRPSLQTASG